MHLALAVWAIFLLLFWVFIIRPWRAARRHRRNMRRMHELLYPQTPLKPPPPWDAPRPVAAAPVARPPRPEPLPTWVGVGVFCGGWMVIIVWALWPTL